MGLRDITERKRAEEALRESEERFRTAFEEGAVAMALTALDSTLLKVNSSFCRMLGFSESELVGRSFTEITHPDDVAANLVGTRQLASGEISSFRMEKRYIRKDGAVVWADMNTASVRDAQGRPLYCVTHVQDITERKQAEEALRRLNERLEQQVAQRTEDLRHTVDRLQQLTLELSQAEDRERKRIADILHDDVQQTLAAAKFHLNLLSSEPRSAAESQEIVEQVKQMLKDAIEKSRSLSHELSPALYQVDLTEILNWLARHMQQKHGLTVHVEAHGPVDSSSEPLKALLYKVAQELLFNVVKHAEVNEARIRVRRLGRYIYLSVVDRGRGFDPQRLEGAAGFGLLGIRERVQLLGGQMKIKSTRGVGSRILIAVPDEELSQVAAPTESGDGWVQTQSCKKTSRMIFTKAWTPPPWPKKRAPKRDESRLGARSVLPPDVCPTLYASYRTASAAFVVAGAVGAMLPNRPWSSTRAAAGDARREVEGMGVAGSAAVAEGQAPETLDRKGLAGPILERAEPRAGCRVERIDPAVAEVADEQGPAEAAKTRRGQDDAPGRVERTLGREPLEKLAVGVEDVHVAVAGAGHVIVLCGVLQGIGDVELAADVLDVERCEPGRQIGIGEGAGQGHGNEIGVEDIHPARAEVGRVQVVLPAAAAQGQALVDRPQGREVHLQHGRGSAVPGRNRAVLGGEDVLRRLTGGHGKVRRGVEDDAGGAPGDALPAGPGIVTAVRVCTPLPS